MSKPKSNRGGTRAGAGRKPDPNKPIRSTLTLRPKQDSAERFKAQARAGQRSYEQEFERMVGP